MCDAGAEWVARWEAISAAAGRTSESAPAKRMWRLAACGAPLGRLSSSEAMVSRVSFPAAGSNEEGGVDVDRSGVGLSSSLYSSPAKCTRRLVEVLAWERRPPAIKADDADVGGGGRRLSANNQSSNTSPANWTFFVEQARAAVEAPAPTLMLTLAVLKLGAEAAAVALLPGMRLSFDLSTNISCGQVWRTSARLLLTVPIRREERDVLDAVLQRVLMLISDAEG